jgi:uncharacterized protein
LLPWGPALAAIIVLAFTDGKAGLIAWLCQIGRWRLSFIWYIAALSIPLITDLGATGLNLLIGASVVHLKPWHHFLLVIPSFLLIGGQWEEPG